MIRFLAILLLFTQTAQAEPKYSLPYLGPGTDTMSAEEYQRVYKNYIQLSVLLGYPLLENQAPACEQDLRTIFRQSGLFTYPVPNEAEQIRRGKFRKGNFAVESYELAGIAIQVVRDAKNGALDRLILVNSSSPKATRKLAQILRKEILSLETDPRTGLEKVQGLPVGFPHPLLSQESQGLYVKTLKFNNKLEACEPVSFLDNTWVGGFRLNKQDCAELKESVSQVWHGHLSAHDFAQKQIALMKEDTLKHALAKGLSEEEAQKIIQHNFVEPILSEINVIGNSMRNLSQCNALALGQSKNTDEAPTESTGGKASNSAH